MIISILTGCQSSPENRIQPVALTTDESNLLSLLNLQNKVFLFDCFLQKSEINGLKVWFEHYESGILIQQELISEFSTMNDHANFRLGLLLEGDKDESIHVLTDGVTSKTSLSLSELKDQSLIWMKVGLSDAVEIVLNQDITLLGLFYDRGSLRTPDFTDSII